MRHSTLRSCVCVFLLHVSFCWAERFPVHENEVPFDLYGGYLVVVRGSLGKLEKRNFIIDTGTNPSVLDERIARHLGLSGRKEKLRLVNREIDTTTVLISSARLGPLARESVPMLVQDLSFFQSKLGVRIDALIGLDILRTSSFEINYANRRISLGSTTPGSEGVSFKTDPPLVTVEMTIEGQPFRLVVDTGALGLILFDKRASKKPRTWQVTGEVSSWNMSGQFSMQSIQISQSQLGNSGLGGMRAYLTADQSQGLGFDGLMGVSMLRAAQISFDFERRLFTWQARNSKIPLTMEAKRSPGPYVQAPGAMSRSLEWGLAGVGGY
jgi:predicted aspartyl protease